MRSTECPPSFRVFYWVLKVASQSVDGSRKVECSGRSIHVHRSALNYLTGRWRKSVEHRSRKCASAILIIARVQRNLAKGRIVAASGFCPIFDRNSHWTHMSHPAKRHLDRFNRFSTAHTCYQHRSDTDHVQAMRPNINNNNKRERDLLPLPADVHSTAKGERSLISKHVHCQLVRCNP